MPDLGTYLAFIAAVLTYQLAGPGPDMLLVISRGIGRGRRLALLTALGCVGAGVIQVPLLALGLASLVTSSAVAYELLRWLGAGYLLYLGLRLILVRRQIKGFDEVYASSGMTGRSAFFQGFVANLTNPTTLAFMLAILPQFTDPSSGSMTLQFIILGTTMKFSGILTLGSVALVAGTLGGWLSRRPNVIIWQERFSGLILVALSLHLIFAGSGPIRI